MATETSDAPLHFRLPPELIRDIEAAADALGQSVSEFVADAATAYVRKLDDFIQGRDVTVLSDRDRDRFLTLLDDVDATPNAALVEAAARYKKSLVD